eukprot:2034650-Rhodomonas_salina.1
MQCTAAGWDKCGASVHPEIKYKKPQSQYILYQECGVCSFRGIWTLYCTPRTARERKEKLGARRQAQSKAGHCA